MIRKIAVAAMLMLGGCAHIGVQPWQRDSLARQSMQPANEGTVGSYHDHIYFSKEGATGGRSADGGGCGCN